LNPQGKVDLLFDYGGKDVRASIKNTDMGQIAYFDKRKNMVLPSKISLSSGTSLAMFLENI